jgi:AraC family transcriptional regulator of adaptative response/methylated-DNA-[protein]-cysteine methyltransferase
MDNEDRYWQALVQRDPKAEGLFVYGVVTTAVYCRPGCPSRRPNREHVRFFDTWVTAEQAGFRPCKRCTPRLSGEQHCHIEAIIQACRLIEEAEESPSLASLASRVGLSSSHFHRLFKQMVGVTPKQYALEHRLRRVRQNLEAGSKITDAVYDAGFGSGSRFYEQAIPALGMTPAEYKNGARGKPIRFSIGKSYLGLVLVAATEQGICRIDFGDTSRVLEERLQARFPQAEFQDADPEFARQVSEVLGFLESPRQGLDLPLDIQGTAFQRRVWMALREIPAGSTASYGELASQIGRPKAARAVAQACAANAIAVAIPCHRAVRSNGEVGDYRWGAERKRAILEREGR